MTIWLICRRIERKDSTSILTNNEESYNTLNSMCYMLDYILLLFRFQRFVYLINQEISKQTESEFQVQQNSSRTVFILKPRRHDA